MKQPIKLERTPRSRIRRTIYLIAVVVVAIYLWQVGSAPWIHAAQRWPVMIALAVLSAFGLAVQTMAFRFMTPPDERPAFDTTLAIWSISAALSVVAPLMAGIAARTTLLIRHGMNLKACGLASLRQIWLGLEYAFLLSALALPLTNWEIGLTAGGICILAWAAMFALRLKARSHRPGKIPEHFSNLIHAFSAPVPSRAHPWFVLQVLTMSAIYFFGFNGFGAEISIPQAISISGLTVIISLIAFLPNGIGITDLVWIAFAKNFGITLEESIAIAIAIRLSHLLASTIVGALMSKKLRSHKAFKSC